MVFVLLSPAKTLAFDRPRPGLKGETPYFQDRAVEIAAVLKKLSVKEIATLMELSDKLAQLNAARFKAFSAKPEADATDLAILAFRGDTYIGLDAKTLTDTQIKAAQSRIGMLSGLYGLLQPLDLMQPYRLEMSTPLEIGQGKDKAKNLYDYWGDAITERINALVKKHKYKAVVGCASHEYLSAVDTKKLIVPFIHCEFKETKNGKTVAVGLLAKRARGMMARYVLENGITDPSLLKKFDKNGYAFHKAASDETTFVFKR